MVSFLMERDEAERGPAPESTGGRRPAARVAWPVSAQVEDDLAAAVAGLDITVGVHRLSRSYGADRVVVGVVWSLPGDSPPKGAFLLRRWDLGAEHPWVSVPVAFGLPVVMTHGDGNGGSHVEHGALVQWLLPVLRPGASVGGVRQRVCPGGEETTGRVGVGPLCRKTL